jgi:hypothetical protein
MIRRTGVRRRVRYGRARCRPERLLARTPHHRVVYRGRVSAMVLMLLFALAVFAVGILAGHTVAGTVVAGLVVVGWIAYGVRVRRPVPAGPGGDGPAPPGGASMREPRRPLPVAPAGTAARQRYEDEPPGQAVALA